MPSTTSRSLSPRAPLFLFCLVCCPLIPSVAHLSFNISSFHTDLSDILYEGVATLAYGYVDLTKCNTPPHFRVGRIQYAKPVPIWDTLTGRQADFSIRFCSLLTRTTRFPFTIDNDGFGLYGDGIAFFLAPAGMPILPNLGGGFLGLFNASIASEGPQNLIVMVEFDTYVNPEFNPPVHHIGINKNELS
ncbi:hypothetical protein ACJRO7_029714 [Eucalyptus globulus]|uniref:Legume lectin domain-containing protein n=1 Tax=Eucalyptus globulus TaxID=34317 RepID=A0ABD3JC71_EUCGL